MKIVGFAGSGDPVWQERKIAVPKKRDQNERAPQLFPEVPVCSFESL